MDPVLGSVLGSFIVTAGAIVVAIIQARSSAERLERESRIDRLERRLIHTHGEDPTDVANL